MALDNGRPQEGTSGGEPGGAPEFDFERGYNELRPEFTRVTQELSQTRSALSEYEQIFNALQDPEHQAEALAALGYDLEDPGSQQGGPGNEEFVDPLEQELALTRQELEEVRARLAREDAESEQAEILEARDSYIGEAISYIEDSLKVKFSEKEEVALGNLAIAMAGDDDVPDVQAAYNHLYGNEGLRETWRQQWIDTKTGAAFPPLGTSIPADRRPKNARERVAYIDERLQALDREQ